jgi:hypothetical protein
MATATTAAKAATPASTEAPKYAIFRDFNTVTFQARIQHTEVRSGDNGEYVTVTAITNLKDGVDGVAVRFTASTGILKLAKGGHLMPGRRVHLVGTIAAFESAYTNADGLVVPLARPRLQLQQVQLTLGAKPGKAKA